MSDKEVPSLPSHPDAASKRIGCVIMASGLGKRFGENKLMTPFRAAPLIAAALQATEGLFSRRVTVTRHRDVAEYCAGHTEVILHQEPLRSDTVRIGLTAMKDLDACLFCPGDQPLLKQETVELMLRHFRKDPDLIYRIADGNTAGAPILFPSWTFPELLSLPPGKGGSHIARKYASQVRFIPVSDPLELKDIDTPQDLEELKNLMS